MWPTFEAEYRGEDAGLADALEMQVLVRLRDVPNAHYAWVNGWWEDADTIQLTNQAPILLSQVRRGTEITDVRSIESYGRIVR